MRGQFLALMLALPATICFAGDVQAHRLDAEASFLPGRMVRVEAWFDNGEKPKKGQVQVKDRGGEVLVKGELSSQAIFVFDAPEGQALQVVVDAGEGHRAEFAIDPAQLLAAQAPEAAGTTNPPPATPARHEEARPIKDILTGIALLTAVAALAMSLRNARTLRALRPPQD